MEFPRQDETPENKKLALRQWAALAVFIPLFLWGLALAGARVYARWGASPAELARVKKLVEDRVTVPAEWINPPALSRQLVEASNEIARAAEAWKAATPDELAFPRFAGRPATASFVDELTAEERALAARLLASADPVFAGLAAAVVAPDYELGALRDRRGPFEVPDISFALGEFFANAHRLLALKANVLANEGRDAEALDAALLLLRVGRRHECSSLVTHLYGMWFARLGSQAAGLVARRGTDARAIAKTLEELEALPPSIFHDAIGKHGTILDSMGVLRDFRRFGYPPDLTANETEAHYLFASLLGVWKYRPWRAKSLPPGDPEADVLDPTGEIRAGTGAHRHDFPPKWVVALGFERSFQEYFLFRFGTPDLAEAVRRERQSVALYRLARLALAQRLAELDPASRPPLLDDGLVDPFDPADGKLRWSDDLKAHYCVGPDGKDDAAKTLVPEDELDRPGDIVLRAFHPKSAATQPIADASMETP